jgi:hypothetical protein
MNTIQERVNAGAEFMDEVFPGWANRINVDKLDIIDGDHCVLGQIYGGAETMYSKYTYVVNDLYAQGHWPYNEGVMETARELGFIGYGDDGKELTECWKNEIRSRQASALVIDLTVVDNVTAENVFLAPFV